LKKRTPKKEQTNKQTNKYVYPTINNPILSDNFDVGFQSGLREFVSARMSDIGTAFESRNI
jgi:hypothetical protein